MPFLLEARPHLRTVCYGALQIDTDGERIVIRERTLRQVLDPATGEWETLPESLMAPARDHVIDDQVLVDPATFAPTTDATSGRPAWTFFRTATLEGLGYVSLQGGLYDGLKQVVDRYLLAVHELPLDTPTF